MARRNKNPKTDRHQARKHYDNAWAKKLLKSLQEERNNSSKEEKQLIL